MATRQGLQALLRLSGRLLLPAAVIGAALVATVMTSSDAQASHPRFLKLPFSSQTYWVTQSYWSGHRAYDMDPGGSAVNATIRAAAGGTAYVRRTTYWNDPGCSSRELSSGGYGLYVEIRHSNGYRTFYAHLASAAWPVNSGGHTVLQGRAIGREGNTGCAFGKHLHFGVSNSSGTPVNPGHPKSPTCGGVTHPLWTTCPASFP